MSQNMRFTSAGEIARLIQHDWLPQPLSQVPATVVAPTDVSTSTPSLLALPTVASKERAIIEAARAYDASIPEGWSSEAFGHLMDHVLIRLSEARTLDVFRHPGAWDAIASACSMSVEVCRETWEKLVQRATTVRIVLKISEGKITWDEASARLVGPQTA